MENDEQNKKRKQRNIYFGDKYMSTSCLSSFTVFSFTAIRLPLDDIRRPFLKCRVLKVDKHVFEAGTCALTATVIFQFRSGCGYANGELQESL